MSIVALLLGIVGGLLSACGDAPTARPGGELFGGLPRDQFCFDQDVFLTVMDPQYVPAGKATGTHDDDAVMGVVVAHAARAYPMPILAYHHAVNDVLGGTPVVVTYCALCSSGIAFDPVVDGLRLTFGIHGAWRGTATLYDHQTESVWMQVTGKCVAGPLAGKALRPLRRVRHTTWGEWREAHPQTDLLLPVPMEQGGPHPHVYRSGGGAPVGSPFLPDNVKPTMPRPDADPRLGPFDVVEGVLAAQAVRAYPLPDLREARIVEERIGDVEATVWCAPVSGAVVAFDRHAGGRLLSFRMDGGRTVRDRETSSRWNLDGMCVEGALAGRELEPLLAVRSEWYGWSAHHPDSTLWRGSGSD